MRKHLRACMRQHAIPNLSERASVGVHVFRLAVPQSSRLAVCLCSFPFGVNKAIFAICEQESGRVVTKMFLNPELHCCTSRCVCLLSLDDQGWRALALLSALLQFAC